MGRQILLPGDIRDGGLHVWSLVPRPRQVEQATTRFPGGGPTR